LEDVLKQARLSRLINRRMRRPLKPEKVEIVVYYQGDGEEYYSKGITNEFTGNNCLTQTIAWIRKMSATMII